MKRFLCALAVLLLMTGAAQALVYDDGEGLPVILGVGGSFAYARDNQGTLYVWGDNQYGQLGLGSTSQSFKVRTFVNNNEALNLSLLKDIIATSDYSYLWLSDGTLWGVGRNNYAPLLSKSDPQKRHALLPLDFTPVSVALGFGHTLALTAEGTVYAWGRNGDYQVGNGKHKNLDVPYLLPLQNVVQIACGGKFSLALDAGGVLWGWGNNEYRCLDVSTSEPVQQPAVIDTGDIRIAAIDACGNSIVLLDTDGNLWTWGRNDNAQLGYDTGGKTTTEPRKVSLPLPVVQVAAYSSQTYAILSDGSLWSWGNNSYGQLGQGFKSAVDEGILPGQAYGGDVVLVQGGSLFVVAVTRDGTVLTAGISKFGQIGDGSNQSQYTLSPNGMDLILP
jgi:alpha-tubulin suppressor-like RCC1 family protein